MDKACGMRRYSRDFCSADEEILKVCRINNQQLLYASFPAIETEVG
jgi:hypothetical protein